MSAGGTLTVRTRARDGWIRLEVADTGPGVAPEIRPRIFDPFFTTKPVGTGTGLGLSVAHGIVAAHAGRLWLDEGAIGGAIFVLELPVLHPTPAPAAPAPLVPPGHRVLVVDDEASVATLLGEQVKELGCDVIVVRSAAQARALLARERFDLITLDLVMPEESGADLWRYLRETLPEAARRVVFLSGAADPALEQFVESTGRPLLMKPFTLQALTILLGKELSGGGEILRH